MNHKQERLVILVLFFFSLALRIFFIEQKNLWFDEIYSWHNTLISYYNIVIFTAGDIHPPLYYLTLKVWVSLFGSSVIALRSLSAITASAAIFYIYPVSKRILSAENGILVIILYSLSPLNIYFSQEARMASLNLFLNAASVYYFLNILFPRKRESQQGKPKFQLLNLTSPIIISIYIFYSVRLQYIHTIFHFSYWHRK